MPLKEVLFLGVVAVEQLPLLPKIGTGASFAGLGPTKISLQGFPFSVFDAPLVSSTHDHTHDHATSLAD